MAAVFRDVPAWTPDLSFLDRTPTGNLIESFQGMKSRTRLLLRLALTAIILFAGAVAINVWWQARLDRRIDLSRKLVGRWAAEGRNGLVAGPPPVLTGGVTRVPGHSGTAWSFDGASAHVTVTNMPEMAFGAGEDFSVMAWIQPITYPSSFGVMSIVDKRQIGGITTAQGFSFHLEYGHVACQISPATGLQVTRADLLHPTRWPAIWKNRNGPAPINRFISQGPDLCDGQFHHVALTLDRHSATGGKLYVDGKLVLTFDPTKIRGSLANKEPLLIGTHPDTTLTCGFKGLIEDVRLYSRKLSEAEVKAAARAE